jgi:tetratricopeptide (TPR) repeat protein
LKKDWARAIDDLSKAIELNPQDWGALHFRGLAYGEQGQWAKAAADFAKCTQLGSPIPSQSAGWHTLAMAGAGDAAGHRKACMELLEKFSATQDAGIANNIAWACVRFPDAVADASQPLQLAEKAVAIKPGEHASLNTLGAALYRAKRFEDSIKKFEEAIKVHGQGGHASDWLFLAMAHHRLGHMDEAKKWLTEAQHCMDQAAQEKPRGESLFRAVTPSWEQRLELRLIRAEAEALIKDEKKK